MIPEKFIRKLDDCSKRELKNPVVIVYKDKQLIMSSGKSAWSNIRNAKLALLNEIGNLSYTDRPIWREEYGDKGLIEVLIEQKIVEFKNKFE